MNFCVRKKQDGALAEIQAFASKPGGALYSCRTKQAHGISERVRCWQIELLAPEKKASVLNLCKSQGGEIRQDFLCENTVNAAQCETRQDDLSFIEFYPGNQWSNAEAAQECKGTFTEGKYEAIFSASCITKNQAPVVCFEYEDILAAVRDVVRGDCAGDWSENQPCSVPSPAHGCRAFHDDLKGYQTIWFEGKANISELCNDGAIVER